MSEDSTVENLRGQQLNEYRLDTLLGRGGMGCVYKGFDLNLKRETAIKVIIESSRANEKAIARFEREAQAIAQLNHPHVVRVYRYGEANGLLYIAMEYIAGTDLTGLFASYQAEQRFIPPEEASRIIRQICLTLDYIHSKGIIHRDIKPSNILVDKNGNVILTDFGLALLTEIGTQGGFRGTPNYMAPEQVLSSANVVPQSDLYAVGVILYEMFTARLPFVAGDPDEVALMHVDQPPPSPRNENLAISPELEAVILKALAKEPQDRYPTGEALADALDRALFTASDSLSKTDDQLPIIFQRRNHMSSQPTVFISYSHEDVNEKEVLMTHLRVLARDDRIKLWSADQIEPGVTWEREVEQAIVQADIAILLITIHFLDSDFIVDKQIPKLLQRREDEGLIIFPVIAKSCPWESVSWLKQMDVRPGHHKPVWREDGRYALEDLTTIVGEIEKIIQKSSKKLGDTDEFVGTFLGRYQLTELIDRGGMAKVYKTFHPGLRHHMAIKVMDNPLSLMRDSDVDRFQDEAAAVVRLHHDHIVRVYDFAQAKGKHYMVMDLIEGSTLETKMKEGRVSLDETVNIITDLADALDYAHDNEVVHHDLKPANIMFKTEGSKERLLLTDFGIARITGMGGQTIPGMFLGTPNYTSPEQAQGKRGDSRSDIYSLGVILYELVTGRLPFEADTSDGVMRKHINEPAPPPTTINPNLPEAVERVIFKALKKDPDDRYQTAGALAIALQEAVAPEPEPLEDEIDQEPIQSNLRQLPETINRFNVGCSFYGQARNAWQMGNRSEHETMLMVAAREVVGALEWALKVYLRRACRGTKDYAQPERANFHQLMTLMKKYADPPVPPEVKDHLYDYRDMRNAAEHAPGIPASDYLGDAIKTIRQVMLTYLPVDEDQLECSKSPPPPPPPVVNIDSAVPSETAPLTESQRQRLEREKRSLERHIDTLSTKIEALYGDLALENRVAERMRLQAIIDREEKLRAEFESKLEDVERRLGGQSSPVTTDEPMVPPPPSKQDNEFNLRELRRILNRCFDDARFDAFCMESFPEVFDNFTRGLVKTEKITQLLDYARRTPERRTRLLAALEEECEE